MHTYWTILISTLISTPNGLICKFQYQRMFDYCKDHYLPDHYANMGTVVKVLRSLMHNVVVDIYLHSCDSTMCWISKETLMWNAYVIASATLLLNYYILRKIFSPWGENRSENLEQRSYAQWTVCMHVFIACYFETVNANVNCKCQFYMNCNIDVTVWTWSI